MFDYMAEHDPLRILKWINVFALTPAQLTFAAEAAGRAITSSVLVVPTLLRLLDRESSLVREGAILGLRYHLTPEARRRLQDLADNDRDPDIRQIAREALQPD